MIKTTRLPKEFIARTEGPKSKFLGLRQFFEPEVKKSTLEGIDEIQYLEVAPWTSITMHGHEQHEKAEQQSHKVRKSDQPQRGAAGYHFFSSIPFGHILMPYSPGSAGGGVTSKINPFCS